MAIEVLVPALPSTDKGAKKTDKEAQESDVLEQDSAFGLDMDRQGRKQAVVYQEFQGLPVALSSSLQKTIHVRGA